MIYEQQKLETQLISDARISVDVALNRLAVANHLYVCFALFTVMVFI